MAEAVRQDQGGHGEGNPGGQTRLTREQFTALTPREQGYASYMQSAWNPAVPDDCPHEQATPEESEWKEGRFAAMIFAQDSEE